jgi:hypothetical protein
VLSVEPASPREAKDRRIIERTLQRTEQMIARTFEPPGPSIDSTHDYAAASLQPLGMHD